MKKFRFGAQALLNWKRRQRETVETELARLRARQASSLARAEGTAAESERTRQRAVEGARLDAAALQAAHQWSTALAAQSAAAREASRRLEQEATKRLEDLAVARREEEILERLRERGRREWARQAEREAETLAAELFLTRRRNQEDV